jgi:hypothetical protein
MASPEVDPSILVKALDYAWAGVVALGGVVWKNLHEKIASNAVEIDRQRDNIAKLFDKLESHAQRSEDRHHELLTALHVGLNSKADK